MPMYILSFFHWMKGHKVTTRSGFSRQIWALFLGFALITCAQSADAQKRRRNRNNPPAEINTYADDSFFSFPNVNQVPYYQDARLMKQIKSLESKEDWVALYPVLKEYVSNFGIIK